MTEKDVTEFIKRRFPADSNWVTGNCYYFALILADRFNGNIVYDVIKGHFLCKIGKNYYDWTGLVENADKSVLIDWNTFDEYDSLQKKRIIRDCIC